MTTYTIRVCQDCYLTHHYGYAAEDTEYVPDREPLALVPAGADITSGMLHSEHDPDCVDPESCGDDGEGCEHSTFSSRPCEGCGSRLGGTRDALTVWVAP